MKPITPEIYYLNDSDRRGIACTAPGFLAQLRGLTVFDITGKHPERTRVMTTLIHGNEPSGFIAAHQWLMGDEIPETNVRMIFCNPEAAGQKPIFTRRYVGDSEDLNRYFSNPKDPDPDLLVRAENIRKLIAEVSPEAIIDLHNTSGVSPAFGVSICDSEPVLDLAAIFATRLIYTGLRFGSLMEQPFDAPIVTIECGGRDEIMSHQVATEGLARYFSKPDLYAVRCQQITIHHHPIRIELINDASVGYADHRLLCSDVTLIPEIEQFNRHPLPAGEFLGWYHDEPPLPMQAVDEWGVNQIDKLLYVDGGRIFTKQAMQMFMATTNMDIATNDCISYVTIDRSYEK